MTSTWQFHAGQPVVCIDSSALPEQYIEIKEGETYVLAWVGMHANYLAGEYLGVRLVGIDRGVCPMFGDVNVPFRASRFKPVVPDRLASLRALLVPGQPLAPAPEEPCRKAPVKEGEKV